MRARALMERASGVWSSCGVAVLAGVLLSGSHVLGAGDDAPLTPQADPASSLSEGEQTAVAYRAVFDRLSADIAALEQVPSGRGLDSWKLFLDHPELVPLADALVAIAARESCDFGVAERLDPVTEHHAGYNRAKNLLLHRMVAKLMGDRTVPPDDFGRLPDPVGVDEDAARRYGVAALNMAVHFAAEGIHAERRIAPMVVADLLGLARRTPQGLGWAMDTIRASRFVEPLEGLFGYQHATIARLRMLAGAAEEGSERFLALHGLVPTEGETETPLFKATLARYHAVYTLAADTLEDSWDIENPGSEVLAVLRGMPRDLAPARAMMNEIMRSVAEIAAVREDVRAMLKAYPADGPGGEGGDEPAETPEGGDESPTDDDDSADDA